MENKTHENGEESLLRWRISVDDDDSSIIEEFDGVPLLKTVVRTNYLYHLRQSLRKNLDATKQNSNSFIEDHNINKVIKGCSTLLEEKALRNCMIARLYQRMMTSVIKEVKKATSDGLLYLPLKEFAEHQSKASAPPQNKEIQTDITMDFFTNSFAGIQKQTQTLFCGSSASFNTSNVVNSLPVNSSEKYVKGINGIQKNWCVKCNRETLGSLCDHSSTFSRTKSAPFQQTENNTKSDSMSDIPDLNGIVNRCGVKRVYSGKNVKIDPVEIDMKLVNDASQSGGASAKNDEFQLKLRSMNFVESVAYWHHLETGIEDLPPAKRKKLDEHFTRLFGKDHAIDYNFLTDEQKSLTCRKRIAKYVVVELTFYYSKKMIANKQLFKTMAKHITSLLLGRSLYPDPGEIKKCVEEFFLDGRVIRTEDDFYI